MFLKIKQSQQAKLNDVIRQTVELVALLKVEEKNKELKGYIRQIDMIGSEHYRIRNQLTSGKHVRAIYTPLNPILYSKTGDCRDIPIFLSFAPKHTVCTCRLWVLVRTASENYRFLA